MYNKAKATLVAQQINKPKRTERNFLSLLFKKTNSMKQLIHSLLTIASRLDKLSFNLIRIAIFVVFVWIGGLKFAKYEADGIVPFVANSPFMSFFYNKQAPEYKQYKNKEGELVLKNRQWHEANNTYGFSKGLGILIMSIGVLTLLGVATPKIGLFGDLLVIIMTFGTLSFLVTTPECWVPNLGSGEFGFPLLSGAGRLVIKDIVILAGAITLLSYDAKKLLAQCKL